MKTEEQQYDSAESALVQLLNDGAPVAKKGRLDESVEANARAAEDFFAQNGDNKGGKATEEATAGSSNEGVVGELKKVRQENRLMHQKIDAQVHIIQSQWEKMDGMCVEIAQLRADNVRTHSLLREVLARLPAVSSSAVASPAVAFGGGCVNGITGEVVEEEDDEDEEARATAAFAEPVAVDGHYLGITNNHIDLWHGQASTETAFVRRLARAVFCSIDDYMISSQKRGLNDPALNWIKSVFFSRNPPPNEMTGNRMWAECIRAIDNVCRQMRKMRRLGNTFTYDRQSKYFMSRQPKAAASLTHIVKD